MAKKKSVNTLKGIPKGYKTRKKATKKKVTKKKTSNKVKLKKPSYKTKSIGSYNQKMDLVLKNLIFFAILFVASFGLYLVSSNEFYENLFALFSILFGAIGIAILIALLTIFFRRNITQ